MHRDVCPDSPETEGEESIVTAAQKQARAVLAGMTVFHLGCLGVIWTGVSPAARSTRSCRGSA